METLEQLIKRLNIIPSEAEQEYGRSKTRNGYSFVKVYLSGKYITTISIVNDIFPHDLYRVRG